MLWTPPPPKRANSEIHAQNETTFGSADLHTKGSSLPTIATSHPPELALMFEFSFPLLLLTILSLHPTFFFFPYFVV
jgi:hypothetical protein